MQVRLLGEILDCSWLFVLHFYGTARHLCAPIRAFVLARSRGHRRGCSPGSAASRLLRGGRAGVDALFAQHSEGAGLLHQLDSRTTHRWIEGKGGVLDVRALPIG